MNEADIRSKLQKIANTHDGLVIDDPYPCQAEYDYLKKQGSSIIAYVEEFLVSFALYNGSTVGCPTWYYGGKHLIRLLGDIGTSDAYDLIGQTFFIESKYAEWYWNILPESAIVLGQTGDKKYIQTLKRASQHNMAPREQIEKAIDEIMEKDLTIHDDINENDDLKDKISEKISQNPIETHEDLKELNEKAIEKSENVNTEVLTGTLKEVQDEDIDLIADENEEKEEVSSKELKDNKIKENYLKSIGKTLETHEKDYDCDLIEVEDNGEIKDYNNYKTLLTDIGRIWGIVILLLIATAICLVITGFIHFFIVVAFIPAALAIIGALYTIVEFVPKLRSKRDAIYKLVSFIYILPIILFLSFSLIVLGIEGTIYLLIALAIIVVVGFVVLAIFS